jgi:uncharacterized phiE125 gp8 family phage protein
MKLIMRAIAEPAAEPITLGQLRDHVRADDDLDDAALLGFGIAARQMIEAWIGRPIMPQTVRGVCEAWPVTGNIELSMPVNSIETVTYTDAAQTDAEWTTGLIVRVSQGGVTTLRPATGVSWPLLGTDPLITVDAAAGFATVPEPICTAICKLTGYLHADRDGMGNQTYGFGKLPADVRDIVRPWRFGGFLA